MSNISQQEKLAVKIVKTPNEEEIEIAYEEYKLLRTLDHEGIVQMKDAFYN